MTVAPGSSFGRWTVVRELPAERRRPGSPTLRRRVLAECVCGHRQAVWVDDLRLERSTGCHSSRCRARHEIAEELRSSADELGLSPAHLEAIDKWVAEGRERDQERAERLMFGEKGGGRSAGHDR